MALATVPECFIAIYQLIYGFERLSATVLVPDDNNLDGALGNPVSSILYTMTTTAGMAPSDFQTISNGYVVWKRTVKDVRQSSPVVVDQPYKNPGAVYNNSGNL
jgi:hypothetical protein